MAKSNKNAQESNDLNVAGLETAQNVISKTPATSEVESSKFSDLEFLTNENPNDFHTNENISSKYEKEREDKVQEGIEIIKTITLSSGIVVNPLLVLLAKWWEVKPARASIKKLIDAEAEAKGFASDVYIQIELKKQINELSELSSAIERMKYSTTYFKPRKPLSNKVPMTQFTIGSKVYQAPVAAMIALKEEFSGDKEGLRNAALKIATQVGNDIDEL